MFLIDDLKTEYEHGQSSPTFERESVGKDFDDGDGAILHENREPDAILALSPLDRRLLVIHVRFIRHFYYLFVFFLF